MPVARVVRLGIAGCGVAATAYYPPCLARMRSGEITAVCDLNRRRAEASLPVVSDDGLTVSGPLVEARGTERR
jgi:hypothetical protein